MARNNHEARKQAELISRLNEWGNFEPFRDFMQWVYHIPNGGRRSKSEGAMMKSIGVKSGVHDLCCPWPSVDGFGALYIEMKANKGSTSSKQDNFSSFMDAINNRWLVTHDVNLAEFTIVDYMLKAVAKKMEFSKFVAIKCDPYFFDRDTHHLIGSEVVAGLFCDETTQSVHSVRIGLQNEEVYSDA